jgi:hypothetical protein
MEDHEVTGKVSAGKTIPMLAAGGRPSFLRRPPRRKTRQEQVAEQERDWAMPPAGPT